MLLHSKSLETSLDQFSMQPSPFPSGSWYSSSTLADCSPYIPWFPAAMFRKLHIPYRKYQRNQFHAMAMLEFFRIQGKQADWLDQETINFLFLVHLLCFLIIHLIYKYWPSIVVDSYWIGPVFDPTSPVHIFVSSQLLWAMSSLLLV